MTPLSGRLKALAAAAVVLAVVVAARSSFRSSPYPRTVPVVGSVRYQGRPVADADVAFITQGCPRYGIAVTDADGRFCVGTFEPDDGALPGAHKVTVVKMRGLPPPPPFEIAITPEQQKIYEASVAAHAAAARKGHSAIPGRYGREDTTPLEVTVGPEGGTFDLELTDE